MKLDRIGGAFWLLFAILTLTESYHLGLGNLQKPASGLFPFVAACFLGALSIIVFLSAQFEKRKTEEKIWPNLQRWPKVALVFMILIIYAFTLEKIGFLLATFLVILILLKAIEPQPWIKSIVFSLLVAVGSYTLFAVWLQVPLPSGFLSLIGF
jgi:putative tricarboxylic transport membrane protein